MDAGLSRRLPGGDAVSPVVLYSPRRSLRDPEDRVRLSGGTCRAETIDTRAPFYLGDARAPLPDWRPATPQERSILWTESAPPAHRGVGIVRLLGPQLIRLFAARRDIFERADDGDTLKHPLIGLLLDLVRNAGLIAKHVYSARIGRDQPGLLTMTRAVDQDARIGLHFDRWDKLAVDELESSSNRVSINLGPSDRYFIFLNQTACGMATILRTAEIQVVRDVRAIGAAFMQAFPQYPIVRLRLRPGDAYIAPTENILHDGSSADVVETNHYLSLRGRFDFCASGA
ncbi:MAG: hypothetical protein HY056_16605 [Proteobacteria bacterium]|nr:hypothetical protein [Pseudomonadota bacterium]